MKVSAAVQSQFYSNKKAPMTRSALKKNVQAQCTTFADALKKNESEAE